MSNFQLVARSDEGNGLELVEIVAELQNLDVGEFGRGSVIPQLEAAGLGLSVEALVRPLEFGTVAPLASTSTAAAMQVRLPTTAVDDLLDALESGRAPLRIEALESTRYASDVQVEPWRATGGWIEGGGLNFFPGQPEPWENRPVVGRFFIVEDRAVYTPENLPLELRNVRATAFVPPDPGEPYSIEFESVEGETLVDLVQSGSFCSGDAQQIDPPIQATRLSIIDRTTTSQEEREGRGQPIRFNNVALGNGVSLSGQVGGHVLKPSFELRVRDGNFKLTVELETELSLTAQVEAELSASIPRDPQSLYTLCFPLPPITAGPLNIPLSLRLDHEVYAEGEAVAGLAAGLSQTFQSTTELSYDSGAPAGARFQSSVTRTPTPIEVTPPFLTSDTGATLIAGTTIRTALVLSDDCLTGVGGYAEVDAFATLDIDPQADPWWRLGADAEVSVGLEASIFGIEVAEAALPVALPRAAERDSGGPAVPGSVSGQDHRWAAVVDNLDSSSGLTTNIDLDVDSTGNAMVTGQGNITSHNQLVALDPSGAYRWNVSFGNGYQPIGPRFRPEVEDEVLVVGKSSGGTWLASLDPNDGAVEWARQYSIVDPADPTRRCAAAGFEAVAPERGGGVIIAGSYGRSTVTANDVCAARVDADGNLLWATIYAQPSSQALLDAEPLANGGFALVGYTNYHVDPTLPWKHALMMVVDETGQIEWASALQTVGRPSTANAVVEDVDGTLYWVGESLRTVLQTGALFVGRIAADGSDVRHALVTQDETFEQELGDYADTGGGDTPYDVGYGIARTARGFVVAGRTGSPLNANETAAWAFHVNRSLGVEWHTTIDGPYQDQLTAVVSTPDAIYVAGSSESFTPLGTGGERQSLLVGKLPHDGRVSLRPETGVVSAFVSPGVRASSLDNTVIAGMEALDVTFDVIAPEVTVTDITATILRTRDATCVTQLTTSGRASVLDDCAHDTDADTVADHEDVCPLVPDPDQSDFDGDGRGDACDEDDDGDFVLDTEDECPMDPEKVLAGACGCGVNEQSCGTGGAGGAGESSTLGGATVAGAASAGEPGNDGALGGGEPSGGAPSGDNPGNGPSGGSSPGGPAYAGELTNGGVGGAGGESTPGVDPPILVGGDGGSAGGGVLGGGGSPDSAPQPPPDDSDTSGHGRRGCTASGAPSPGGHWIALAALLIAMGMRRNLFRERAPSPLAHQRSRLAGCAGVRGWTRFRFRADSNAG